MAKAKKPKHIAIAGNIGAGKTTLAHLLSNDVITPIVNTWMLNYSAGMVGDCKDGKTTVLLSQLRPILNDYFGLVF